MDWSVNDNFILSFVAAVRTRATRSSSRPAAPIRSVRHDLRGLQFLTQRSRMKAGTRVTTLTRFREWRFLQLTVVLGLWMLLSPRLGDRWIVQAFMQVILLNAMLVTLWVDLENRRRPWILPSLWCPFVRRIPDRPAANRGGVPGSHSEGRNRGPRTPRHCLCRRDPDLCLPPQRRDARRNLRRGVGIHADRICVCRMSICSS